MTKTNNFKHLKRNFLLVLGNVVLLVILFMYIPVSTLVVIAMIPGIIHAFLSKRYALLIITILIFAFGFVSIFLLLLNPAIQVEIARNVSFAVSLFSIIFPYELSTNVLSFMPVEVLFYMALFMFAILFVSCMIGVNEFNVMTTFSYFIALFSTIYLIINVLTFVVPQLSLLILNNNIAQMILVFFYLILPFITLDFSLLAIELFIIDTYKRKDYEIYMKKSKDKKSKTFDRLSTILIIFVIALIGLFIYLSIYMY